MPIGRSQIPQQVEGKLRGARGEKPRDKRKPIDPRTKKDTLRQKIAPKEKINRLQELRRELGMKKGGMKNGRKLNKLAVQLGKSAKLHSKQAKVVKGIIRGSKKRNRKKA